MLRAGLVVGPHDHTERFAYWPRRVARGGEVLAAEPDPPVQFIGARDFGSWAVAALEAGTVGVFNAVGPAEPMTMAQLLATCVLVTGSDAQSVWAGCRARGAGLRTRPPRETIADVLQWDTERNPAERRDAMPADRERELLANVRK